ncbi:MAG: hypothetical protein RR202_06115 [Bacteroidales bacterium]
MAIKYTVVQRENPAHREMGKQFLAQVKYTDETTFQQICEMISLRSLMTRSDVETVLSALIQILVVQTMNSRAVQLGEFGSVSLAMRSEPVADPKDFKKANIRGLHYVFAPGAQLRSALQGARFKAFSVPKTPEVSE